MLRLLHGILSLRRLQGAAVCIATGLLFLMSPLGDYLRGLSYDSMFRFRGDVVLDKVRAKALVVATDDVSLGPDEHPIPRKRYAELLRSLKRRGVEVVVFDILFQHLRDPADTAELAKAIKEFGDGNPHGTNSVILASVRHTRTTISGATEVREERLLEPCEPLLSSAATALVNAPTGLDANQTLRRHFEHSRFPTLAQKAFSVIMPEGKGTPPSNLWINYYGPPRSDTVPRVSLYDALATGGVSTNVLRGKIVFVGVDFKVERKAEDGELDKHRTPYTTWSGKEMPGVEVQATMFLNLWRGDGITELHPMFQFLLVVALGFGLGTGLTGMQTFRALRMAVGAACVVAVVAYLAFVHGHVYFPWLIVSVVQASTAVIWCGLVSTVPAYFKYGVFISYRREGGADIAAIVHDRLKDARWKPFLDRIALGSGLFDKRLELVIEKTPNFVLVLSPGALDRCRHENDWVRQELRQAIRQDKNVVPITLPDFAWPAAESLPDDIRAVTRYNAVKYSRDFPDAALEELERCLEHPTLAATNSSPS